MLFPQANKNPITSIGFRPSAFTSVGISRRIV
jgi:hypothetical protein